MTVLAFTSVALRRTLRDRGNLFFLFVFPLALIFLVGQQFGGQAAGPSVGVVTPIEADEITDDLRAALDDTDAIQVTEVADLATLEREVADGSLAVGVVLPTGDRQPPTARLVAGSAAAAPAAEQLVTTALDSAAAEARDVVTIAEITGVDPAEVDAAWTAAGESASEVSLRTRTVGSGVDEEFAGASTYSVGASAQLLLFVFVTSLAGSGALIQARRWGVTRRALAAPVRSRTVLIGEAAGRFAVAATQAAIILVGTALLYDVDWGDPLATGVVALLFCLVGAACAMLLGALASNDAQASGGGVVLGLGLAALGGCMLPLELFPDTLRRVAHLTPHAWGLDALAEIVRREGTLADVLTEVGVLAAFAGVLLVVASWRLRAVVVRTGR